MNTTLIRRIERAEVNCAVKKFTPRKMCLIAGLLDSANDQDREVFQRRLSEAEQSHDLVIVLTPIAKAHHSTGKVKFASSDAEAGLMLAAATPSSRGNRDQVADILGDLSGNILGPVAAGSRPNGDHYR